MTDRIQRPANAAKPQPARAAQSGPLSAPTTPAPAQKPAAKAPASDGKQLSGAAAEALAAPIDGGEAHSVWEENIVVPVQEARKFWKDMGKQDGAMGYVAKGMGTLLDFSGVPSITSDVGSALDRRKATGERLKAAGWAAGNIVLNFVPIGKVGNVGSKVFKLTGGAKVLQRLRNATLLGAEVKAGTKILHYTSKAAGEAIVKSGVLQGSKRGFLSMTGMRRHLAVTMQGLKSRVVNNGQIYAMAADGKTKRLASVVDAIVGVGADTKLGKFLGKISPPKTGYDTVVEHVLTAAEAAGSRRWGRTIVTNVLPGQAGLSVAASSVKAVPGVVAAPFKAPGAMAKAAENAFGTVVGKVVEHADLATAGYVRLLQQADND
jgi:hypothetical protein